MTFFSCMHLQFNLLDYSYSSILYIFLLGLIKKKKKSAVTDIVFPDPADISAASSVIGTVIAEDGISEG